jgi:hypothetical protein
MREIGYEGYFCYELCHPFLGQAHEWLGLDDVDKQVKLAREFMTALLEKNRPEVAGKSKAQP